jgi:nucleoside-diphosphate-sugar epimerase
LNGIARHRVNTELIARQWDDLLRAAGSLKLGAVHPTRDFNYVRDTVRGFVAIAECDAAVGRVVNVGSNYEVTIGDTARLIAELMGREVEFTSDEQRLRPAGSEVERLWADNTLAHELAGWSPEFAGIEGLRRGLAETIEWFGNKDNLRRYKAGLYNI